MANLIDLTNAANQAFSAATLQAQQTTQDLFRQYGFVMPSASGGFTTNAAAEAWNPANLATNPNPGMYQMGATGEIADIARQGAEAEATANLQNLQSGLSEGGLAKQRLRVAELRTGEATEKATEDFQSRMNAIAGQYIQADATRQENIASYERQAAEETARMYAENPTPEDRQFRYGKPGGKPPKSPKKGTRYTGPKGGKWRYDGKGWKRVYN